MISRSLLGKPTGKNWQLNWVSGKLTCWFFHLIIAQNPQVVLPGASITVGSGVGIFPYGNRYRMEVAVNNRPSTPLQNGIENILVKAEQRPGYYKVPLVIRYLDQDGKRQEIRKLIEYTVVDTLCGPGH